MCMAPFLLPTPAPAPVHPAPAYRPRGRTELRRLFHERFPAFEAAHEVKYAKGCGFDYFRPFSCKSFFLCPSCGQKRTLLLGEYLADDLLLRLPRRQFVWTIPKALRGFLKRDRSLFAEVGKLIFSLIAEYYTTAAGRPLVTGNEGCRQEMKRGSGMPAGNPRRPGPSRHAERRKSAGQEFTAAPGTEELPLFPYHFSAQHREHGMPRDLNALEGRVVRFLVKISDA